MQNAVTDVLVLGGGPAGSSAANFLAQAGHRVILVERERFPRHHVGESLLPAIWDLWDELGVTEPLENENFTVKAGVNFGFGPETEITLLTGEFPEYFQRTYAYHVERSRFDDILLRRAAELGVDVRQGWVAHDVLMDGDRVCGALAGPEGEEPIEIRASVVVDATGRDCLIGKKEGLHREDSVLNKIAYWTHVEGAEVKLFEGATRTDIHTLDGGWVWYIPLSEDVVSVGAVLDTLAIRSWPEKAPQDRFDRAVASNEKISGWLKNATQRGPMHVVSNISYLNERFVGNGYALVGDASMFVDPVFSAGVTLAIRSAKFAAEAIHEALEAGDVSRERLAPYEERIKHPMDRVFKLIHNWYQILDRDDRDNIFVRSQRIPLLRERLVVLLSGGYDRADMDEMLAEAETPVA